MDFEEAAMRPLTGQTAWHCLIEYIYIKPWEGMLIQAVGSGIGSAGLLIAQGLRSRSRRSVAVMTQRVHHGGLSVMVGQASALTAIAKAPEIMTGR
jgi:NADPH:quinone reductase-like Zn-dependent oxidoreductase